MLNNRSMKLHTIYIALCIPLCKHIHKEGKISRVLILQDVHNVIFKFQEYYITSLLGQNIFSLKTNMLYMCSHSSTKMETLLDNLSVKAIIIDLLV